MPLSSRPSVSPCSPRSRSQLRVVPRPPSSYLLFHIETGAKTSWRSLTRLVVTSLTRFETDEFFQQLANHPGGGDRSDEARFRHYAATRLHFTNQIGVAKTILAHHPVTDVRWMDGSTVHFPARTPKIQGVSFVVDSAEPEGVSGSGPRGTRWARWGARGAYTSSGPLARPQTNSILSALRD